MNKVITTKFRQYHPAFCTGFPIVTIEHEFWDDIDYNEILQHHHFEQYKDKCKLVWSKDYKYLLGEYPDEKRFVLGHLRIVSEETPLSIVGQAPKTEQNSKPAVLKVSIGYSDKENKNEQE